MSETKPEQDVCYASPTKKVLCQSVSIDIIQDRLTIDDVTADAQTGHTILKTPYNVFNALNKR